VAAAQTSRDFFFFFLALLTCGISVEEIEVFQHAALEGGKGENSAMLQYV